MEGEVQVCAGRPGRGEHFAETRTRPWIGPDRSHRRAGLPSGLPNPARRPTPAADHSFSGSGEVGAGSVSGPRVSVFPMPTSSGPSRPRGWRE